jgi:formate dehydrogenase major subunit
VLYGSDISESSVAAMKKLDDKVKFIAMESGVNTRASKAFGINNGFNPSAVQLLYVAQGEQNCDGKDLLKKIPKGAFIIVQSSYLSELTEKADLVLPTAIWSERTGSLTNTEGRTQLVNRAVKPEGQAKSDWEILKMLAEKLDRKIAVSTDEVSASLKKLL